MRRHHRAARGVQVCILAATVVFAVSGTPLIHAATVKNHDWLNDDYVLSSMLTTNTDYYTNNLCYKATVAVAGYDEPQKGCVFSDHYYELLRSSDSMAIRFGSETQFYPIVTNDDSPQSYNWMYLVPDHDTLVYYRTTNDQTFMTVYGAFSSKLTKIDDNGHVAYSLVGVAPNFVLHDSNGNPENVAPRTAAHSNNGRYALVDLEAGGVVRIDVLEYKQRAITGVTRHGSLDMWPWETSTAASDNGDYVVVGGDFSVNEIRVYQISGDCGGEFVDGLSVADVCPKISIPYQEFESVGLHHASDPAYMVYFDTYDNVITYFDKYNAGYFHCNSNTHEESDSCPLQAELKITIGSTGMQTALLDYLAIGDSYTSGEGDVSKDARVSHYLPLTDFDGGCHLSSRSYPFLLRTYWSVAPTKMHSVACSGARVNEDYVSSPTSYLGQSSQLRSLSTDSRSALQTNALENFTPGVVPQLEFIRKYKPKIVTLTGGGNDVGFANLIKDCAISSFLCSPAVQGSPDRMILEQNINSSYNTELRLLQMIKFLSPASKIYVIGYPQFVKNGACILNSGLLNSEEITMVNESVSRLNTVLSRAAQNAGVEFVSVEDSLVGGRLCEGSGYMTGAINSFLSSWNPAAQTSFHPNAAGHQKMAEAIRNQTGTNPPRLQDADTYANDFDSVQLDQVAIMNYMAMTAKTSVPAGKIIQLTLPPLTLLSHGIVKLFLHSEPLYLGAFTANDDGSLSGLVTLPDTVPLGGHTLVLEGYSYSGEPLTYYQNITVESSNPDDRDGDGIPNIEDRCDFVPYWFDETTGKDICIPDELSAFSQLHRTSPQTSNTPQSPATLYSNPLVRLLRPPQSNTSTRTSHSSEQQFERAHTGILIAIVTSSLLFLACISAVVYSNHKK